MKLILSILLLSPMLISNFAISSENAGNNDKNSDQKIAEKSAPKNDDAKGFGLTTIYSIFKETGLDEKILQKLTDAVHNVATDPKLKSDIEALQKRFDAMETQEGKLKLAQEGLVLLQKKYLICMCEKSWLPCYTCFSWY